MGSKAQNPRLASLRCHECGRDIATLEASAHFKNADRQHSKSFNEKLSTDRKHSQVVYYYRLPNLMFECYYMPDHYFKTKESLRVHLENLDTADIIRAHQAEYKGQKNKPNGDR